MSPGHGYGLPGAVHTCCIRKESGRRRGRHHVEAARRGGSPALMPPEGQGQIWPVAASLACRVMHRSPCPPDMAAIARGAIAPVASLPGCARSLPRAKSALVTAVLSIGPDPKVRTL